MALLTTHLGSPKDAGIHSLPPTPESLSPPPSDAGHSTLDDASQVAFDRWRPSFHLQPAKGWMNDPCGPGFDPATGLYHVSFQWNAGGNDWGDIAWGHATSSDLVSWDIDQHPSLSPDTPYDHLGVFTGCFYPSGATSPLVYFYTSVNSLPIHHTLPYKRGCESLSIASSVDNGRTWVKHSSNPIIPSAPRDVEVTGWRDPFVSKWDSLSRVLERDSDAMYGIISGGIVDKTPTTFIYAISPSDISTWEYLGPLVDFGLNMRPSRWSGDLGRNWEVTNFVTLRDKLDPAVSRDFLIMGTEGCVETGATNNGAPNRPSRCQLWMAGSLRTKQDGESSKRKPAMDYLFGGHLDHGCYYAANSFFDPISQSQIVWGWVTEEDLGDTLRREQNWSGMMSLPRTVQLATIPRVSRACQSDLASITSIEALPDGLGTFTIRTLTSIPDRRVVEKLRNGPGVQVSHLPSGLNLASPASAMTQSIKSKSWELSCSIKVSRNCQRTGVRIGHCSDFSKETVLYFEPMSETFTIERPRLNPPDSALHINSAPERAAHTLFTTIDHSTGATEKEHLEIRIWRDNSVLEVFVNERTAITTRIYADDVTSAVSFFAEECQGISSCEATTQLDFGTIWDGIGVA